MVDKIKLVDEYQVHEDTTIKSKEIIFKYDVSKINLLNKIKDIKYYELTNEWGAYSINDKKPKICQNKNYYYSLELYIQETEKVKDIVDLNKKLNLIHLQNQNFDFYILTKIILNDIDIKIISIFQDLISLKHVFGKDFIKTPYYNPEFSSIKVDDEFMLKIMKIFNNKNIITKYDSFVSFLDNKLKSTSHMKYIIELFSLVF